MIIEEKLSRTFNILHWIEDVMESYGTTNKTIAELLLEVDIVVVVVMMHISGYPDWLTTTVVVSCCVCTDQSCISSQRISGHQTSGFTSDSSKSQTQDGPVSSFISASLLSTTQNIVHSCYIQVNWTSTSHMVDKKLVEMELPCQTYIPSFIGFARIYMWSR